MNLKQIKTSFTISGYLSTINLEPVRKNGNQWLYHSPFHQDNKPSFSVNVEDNLWRDFATGTGGDLIDLVKLLHRTNTAGAIATLTGTSNLKPVFSFYRQSSLSTSGDKVEISYIQPIRNQALIDYLAERMIPINTARYYLQEAYYKTKSDQLKSFFALAFKNDQGGHALRNKIWKGASSPAYFTTIRGRWSDQVNIFEGVFDFLSALVYFKSEIPKLDCIVLNSNSHINSALPMLKKYTRVNLFLDRDKSGEVTAEKIRSAHNFVVDYAAKIYPENKDFNEFLQATQNPQ
jgi:hypothetical protein